MFAPREPPKAAPEGRAGNLQLYGCSNAVGREPLLRRVQSLRVPWPHA